MQCPLRTIAFKLEREENDPLRLCVKEDCAWWLAGEKQCTFTQIPELIAEISEGLGAVLQALAK